MRTTILLALLTPLAFCLPASAFPLKAKAVPLHISDAAVTSIGKLNYVAGFHLTADDARFGGLSGFELAPDGSTLIGVSDRGLWITVTLSHDSAGRLTGATAADAFPILGDKGQRLSKQWGDAEEVAILPGGDVVVSFEHHHRLGRFGKLAALSTTHELPFHTPRDIKRAPPNGGIEAIAAFPDGRLLALREKPHDTSGHFQGWLISPKTGAEIALSYATVDGFQPTGITVLRNGDIIVLERRFSMLTGIAARLVRVKPDQLKAGAVIKTTELGRMGGRVTCDNFEALAARELPGQPVRLYVGSDDNYSSAQETLLLQFEFPR